MKIGHPRDFWTGVIFALIGAFFAVIAYGVKFGDTVLLAGYSMGTPARMGPAFFPFYLGLIMFGLGVTIAIYGVLEKGGGEEARFPKFHWGPIAFVLGSVVLFGLVMKPIGMMLAGILLVLIASAGNPEGVKWKSTIILAISLVVVCALVFVWGLKLPIPLCPDIEALQSAVGFCRS
jgi:hypothetical protein